MEDWEGGGRGVPSCAVVSTVCSHVSNDMAHPQKFFSPNIYGILLKGGLIFIAKVR